MDDHTLEDLVRRLTALVVKIDERDTQMVAILEELRAFNREQVTINQRLETLLERAWRSSTNGHTD
jgi:hypothetical protein